MRVLVADEDPTVLDLCSRQIRRAGFDVTVATHGSQAWEAFCSEPFPVVLTDIEMPGIDGFELIRRIRSCAEGKATQVVVHSAAAKELDSCAVRDLGVFECLVKPQGISRLPEVIWRASNTWENARGIEELAKPEGLQPEDRLCRALQERYDMLVVSKHMRDVANLALRFHEAPQIPVLIQGPTGTGKEAIARLVHQGMKEETGPFIDVNCAAVSPTLLESELFGYAKGAFTGANREGQVGKFELAHGGTLFLDELGEMPKEFQSKLLRVLEQGFIRRVGGTKLIPVQVRIVCATNRELTEQVAAGEFREDLYYRLSVGVIRLRPLCQRPEAILPLATHFLKRQSRRLGKPFTSIHSQAVEKLQSFDWPGNVRELRNVIDRAVALHSSHVLRAEHLDLPGHDRRTDEEATDKAGPGYLEQSFLSLPEGGFQLNELVNEIVLGALRHNKYNKSKTARYLGISRSKLLTHLARIENEEEETP